MVEDLLDLARFRLPILVGPALTRIAELKEVEVVNVTLAVPPEVLRAVSSLYVRLRGYPSTGYTLTGPENSQGN